MATMGATLMTTLLPHERKDSRFKDGRGGSWIGEIGDSGKNDLNGGRIWAGARRSNCCAMANMRKCNVM